MSALRLHHFGLTWLLVLSACNDTGDLAPSSPIAPWQFNAAEDAGTGKKKLGWSSTFNTMPAADGTRRYVLPADPTLPWPEQNVPVDQTHLYTLPELVDLAERNSKETRIAWEQARQAATAVGVAQAALFPVLTADALGGYTHSAMPFPSILSSRGYITSNGEGFFPEVALRYLLFDFGAARASVKEAREGSFASNVVFTGTHQRLILGVAEAYYQVSGANAELAAALASVDNSHLLRRAAESRYAHGEGTVLDVAFARRGVAQADLALVRSTVAQHDAMFALVSALGYPPTTTLQVADASSHPLPRTTSAAVASLMRDALEKRPDLLADLARLRAADARVTLAQASFSPKVSISAHVNANIGAVSVDSGPPESVEQPEGGVFLRLDWPIYEAGLRRNELRLAQSRRSEAADVLQEGQEKALREVASAFDQLEACLAQYQASLAVQAASQTAFDQASHAYAHGLGSITDATSAATALAQARAEIARSHAQAMVSAAVLASSAGNLTSSQALPLSP